MTVLRQLKLSFPQIAGCIQRLHSGRCQFIINNRTLISSIHTSYVYKEGRSN